MAIQNANPGKDILTIGDAVVTNVLSPKTFLAGGNPLKTGTMATVAITDANDDYPAGYHAGNVGGLDAIDLDLASANIKSGVTIFGKAGVATVQEIGAADAAVTDVKAPRTFFSVTGGIKTGTMATVALDPANSTVNAGYYAATTLQAVDADLAVGNIKSGVTIFGFLGTYLSTLSQDLVASAVSADTGVTTGGYYAKITVATGADYDMATTTNTFAANSMAVAIGCLHACDWDGTVQFKLRLYMNGTQVAESGAIGSSPTQIIVKGTRALSGSKICKIAVHNYDPAVSRIICPSSGAINASPIATGIGVGSIKAT